MSQSWFVRGFDDIGIEAELRNVARLQNPDAPLSLKMCLYCGSTWINQIFMMDHNGAAYKAERMFQCGECRELFNDMQNPQYMK